MTTVTFTGKSGTKYSCEVFYDDTEFNPVSGVYILCRQVEGVLVPSRLEALYVGETQSLKDRLNANAINHDGLKRSRQFGMTHFAIIRCEGATERLWVETDLRHSLGPICNEQSVPQDLVGLFS